MRVLLLTTLVTLGLACAQTQPPAWTEEERPILTSLRGLRAVSDNKRASVTRDLALAIRRLQGPGQVRLAVSLAGLSTEGDFGKATLQEVATTLAAAIERNPPPPDRPGSPNVAYLELAQLVRYEHVNVSLDDPQLKAAFGRLDDNDKKRRDANFTLKDLDGKSWTLKDLHGSVVLVNFWATWCPPCRKEMPDLDALYHRFHRKGLVILSVSDEAEATVRSYVAGKHYTYPILLDPGRRVNESYVIEGIPKSFVYDRQGKLVAQAVDMRTMNQFLQMLAVAGMK